MRPQSTKSDISHYFEYSSNGIEVLQDGLQQLSFGEYLVDCKAITRHELLRALQMQDQEPGIRLGECLAKMGIMGYVDIEKHLSRWNGVRVVEVAPN